MALMFQSTSVATIKAKSSTSTDMFTVPGVTTDSTTVANAATQINKLLDIVGFEIAGDEYMTRTITEEAVDND